MNRIQDHLVFLPKDVGLALINDAFPIITKKGCQYEQLANCGSDGMIRVDTEIFESLHPKDRAALYYHEALYKMARDLSGASSSVQTRALVGYLFAHTVRSNESREQERAIRGLIDQERLIAKKSIPCDLDIRLNRKVTGPISVRLVATGIDSIGYDALLYRYYLDLDPRNFNGQQQWSEDSVITEREVPSSEVHDYQIATDASQLENSVLLIRPRGRNSGRAPMKVSFTMSILQNGQEVPGTRSVVSRTVYPEGVSGGHEDPVIATRGFVFKK
ncbi:MAG: hypothetical protein ACXWOH_14045 [Bdellovibrionota bacterium]